MLFGLHEDLDQFEAVATEVVFQLVLFADVFGRGSQDLGHDPFHVVGTGCYTGAMNTDPTLPQGGQERRQSQQRSLQRGQPPIEVPGYEPERLLGVGAYGEVWVALEKNTGRRVAVKFYTHRGGLDWSLLSREVEKLAFLFADRYVVQLIGVGWDAEPPYYVMEYLEQGSLAERIQSGLVPTSEAVEIFRDVAVGLVHAHGKGVLHCDLKPANILLDQDGKPRLADFGQSRLSHEQAPALGTLFYMAPEQADLEAVPDACWDVYALGALLYCMLTGHPPHRSPENVARLEGAGDLRKRLSEYRRMIRHAPAPTAHRQVAGVDRPLAEIIERCLAPDPKRRFPNVQAVLAALDARELARSRRPMMILGGVGPALVLLVVSLFAWQGFSKTVRESRIELTRRALESNAFAAELAARTAGNELERRFEAVEQVARSERLREVLRATVENGGEIQALLGQLSDPKALHDEQVEREVLGPLRDRFRKLEARQRLQEEFEKLIPPRLLPGPRGEAAEDEEVASWFFCDKRGVSTVRVPVSRTIGKNYAWRSFFHGGPSDLAHEWERPEPGQVLDRTKLSAVFRSQAHHQWIVAVTSPVYEKPPFDGEFLGVVALTVKLGQFVEIPVGKPHQYAILVDQREGAHTGVILQHPLMEQLAEKLGGRALDEHRLAPDKLPDTEAKGVGYQDPLAQRSAEVGLGPENKSWLAWAKPVKVRGEPTGWWVVVQEAYDTYDNTILWTLERLRSGLILYGVAALAMVLVVMLGLWGFSIRLLKETSPSRLPVPGADVTERPTSSVTPDAPTEPHHRH